MLQHRRRLPLAFLILCWVGLGLSSCQNETKDDGKQAKYRPTPSPGKIELYGDPKRCIDPELVIFDNFNNGAVQNIGLAPQFDTRTFDPHSGGSSVPAKRYCLIRIETYHWNDGSGAPPGKLGLRDDQGREVQPGPWQSTGSPGQNGAPNVNWSASTPTTTSTTSVVLIHGKYTVSDSSPNTWSSNAQAGSTFARVIVKEYSEGP